MPIVRTALKIVVATGLVIGLALTYWQPQWPLLGYWLLLSIGLGVAISTLPALSGLGRRARWLLAVNAAIVAFALATTQFAARRAISSTHLEYRGVHLAGVNSFTVGANVDDATDGGADVRLQRINSASPWSARVRRTDSGWTIEPLAGVEQLRLGPMPATRREHRFDIAQSAILERPDDWVAVVDPAGTVVDTLRLRDGRLASARANTFFLRAVDRAIENRYARALRAGVSLSALDGRRAAPSAYERFVRVQTLAARDVVNESEQTAGSRYLAWLLPARQRLLIAASPPYTLAAPGLGRGLLSFRDSASVEVRSGDAVWQFELRERRREPSADVGLDLLFVRNPRPLDTPLPTGVSCQDGVACGAISLRRLPPPVAHVALDFAGFDPHRFGLLGRVQQDGRGFTVVLPRQTYRVERSASRPVAIPVTPLHESDRGEVNVSLAGESRGSGSYWVLLAASGAFGDDMSTIVLVGIGLALVLAAIYAGVKAATEGGRALPVYDERWLCLGVTAVLALLLTRVIIGARVAFFAPFLARGIDTAVGMWVAIAIVVVGLLSWSAWVPPLLTGTRAISNGQISLRRLAIGLARFPIVAARGAWSPRVRMTSLFTALALGALALARPGAVAGGAGAGVVVLLAWIALAWVAAFSGPYFETFERGAWAVVEQLTPSDRLASATRIPARRGWTGHLENWCTRIPELPIIAACLAAEAALLPGLALPALAAAIALLVAAVIVARRRRMSGIVRLLPDYWGALAGAMLFVVVIASMRLRSENGSMAAFVLIVLVALVSVRIGRGVGARIDAATRRVTASRSDWSEITISSALLAAPLLLLAPLMAIDMGLFLVVVLPVGFATLLAAGRQVAGWRLAAPLAAFALLFFFLTPRVLFPSVGSIRDADSHASRAAAFDDMTRLLGVRLPLVSKSMDRVAARSVATADQPLAEALLISAKPGSARDLLIPSIEQIWGGTTYASAGFWGGGLGQAVVGGRGVAESVSYAENTFSVFVLAEHGVFGGVLVLALYLLLTVAVGATAISGPPETPGAYRASRALFLVATLIVAIPAAYVALSNLGLVPITGQNMPFLGLNAWSDVAICAGIAGILVTGAIRRTHEVVR
jgi:hypothetical protein